MEWAIILIIGWLMNYAVILSEETKSDIEMEKHIYILGVIPFAVIFLFVTVRLIELMERNRKE